MTNDELRIRVAELCGWTSIGQRRQFPCAGVVGYPPTTSGLLHALPDYPNDLNAMREARQHLTTDIARIAFAQTVQNLMGGPACTTRFDLIDASAEIQARAFVQVMSKEQA